MDMNSVEEAYKNGYANGYRDGKQAVNNIVLCDNCVESDNISCPVGKVWCKKMCRYMKKDGFCSEGK